MITRCNCDASCGENRYHNVGDPECRFRTEAEYDAYWHGTITQFNKDDNKMAKTTKISDKLAKVNESFTVYMYDNGFMIEVGGRDRDGEWKTAKLILGTAEELVAAVAEIASMDRSE